MAILVDERSKVLVQGITGRTGSFATRYMLEYGTNVVAGVTPGRGGANVWGIPVYDTVAEAIREHGQIDVSLTPVPGDIVKGAVLEAIEASIGTVVMPVERMPLHDILETVANMKRKGMRILGPGSFGVISPGKAVVGWIGGSQELANEAYKPGNIGVISRSGGQTTTISWNICRSGLGISTSLHVGAEPILGLTEVELLELFEKDPDTKAVALFGEIGTVQEEEAAQAIMEGRITKPIVAYIAGARLPTGMRFSHASAIVERGRGSAESKISALRKAGVDVVDNIDEIGHRLLQIVGIRETMLMSALRVLRSMLFVPGNSWRMLTGAARHGSDAVIIDLEDAVPIGEKETARVFARDSTASLKDEGIDVLVRVNSSATGLTPQDIKAVVSEELDGIMLPKTESGEEIIQLEKIMEEREKEMRLKTPSLFIMPILETCRGVLNAHEIATASKRVIGLSFGAADFLRDLGRSYATMSVDEQELLYARSQISIAARAADVLAIDTPFLGLIIDEEGLMRESKTALQLGFKGKMIIHPKHVNIVNKTYTPSKQDVEYADKVIKAYEEAAARGLGAASLEGRMIDLATYRMAQELNSFARAIAEKDKRKT